MEAQGWKKPPRKLPKHLQPHQDRKSHIKKIAKWIDPKNPLRDCISVEEIGTDPDDFAVDSSVVRFTLGSLFSDVGISVV